MWEWKASAINTKAISSKKLKANILTLGCFSINELSGSLTNIIALPTVTENVNAEETGDEI